MTESTGSDPTFQRVQQTVAIRSGTEEHGLVIRESHYRRIQERIRREVKSSASSSIWVALALTALGICVSLVVTVTSADLGAESKGKFEVAAWASLILMLAFVAMHMSASRAKAAMAEDICAEMDTYVQHANDG